MESEINTDIRIFMMFILIPYGIGLVGSGINMEKGTLAMFNTTSLFIAGFGISGVNPRFHLK